VLGKGGSTSKMRSKRRVGQKCIIQANVGRIILLIVVYSGVDICAEYRPPRPDSNKAPASPALFVETHARALYGIS
jgi:hypothetical protein